MIVSNLKNRPEGTVLAMGQWHIQNRIFGSVA